MKPLPRLFWLVRLLVAAIFTGRLSIGASGPVKTDSQLTATKQKDPRRVRDRARGVLPGETDIELDGWTARTFEREVSYKTLLELFDDFLYLCQLGLKDKLRAGQVDLEIQDPETVAEHIEDLLALDDEYSVERKLSSWDTLVLKAMHRAHELFEFVGPDLPKFPVPKDVMERRAYIKKWAPLTRRQEQGRWRREWVVERPFAHMAIAGLDERKKRIVVYLFDRFYWGTDLLARLARDLHYLQPALSIWRRTRSKYARDMHFRRANAVIRDKGIREHLHRVYGRRK